MSSFKSTCFILLFTCVVVAISGSYIERLKLDPPPHNRGYDYAKPLNLFYKVHDIPQTWNTARAICEAEGAALMWFHNEDEAVELLEKGPKHYKQIFFGIHSKFTKRVFVTVKGLQIEDVYNNWGIGQPDNMDDHVDCVSISPQGVMAVVHCNMRLPFMCRRDYDGKVNYLDNHCNTYDKGYVHNGQMDRCYKVHTEPKNWTDAYAICSAEGSYLAVINSLEESNILVNIIKHVHVYGNYWFDKTSFLLGFHDMFAEGEYRTIFGETLKEAGFDQFYSEQPNNLDDQNCGGMNTEGKLNDLWCTKPFPFICERDVSFKA